MSSERKICAHCGRMIEPRRMRESDWRQLKYCSASCRKASGARLHWELEQQVLALLAARDPAGSICPSEVARTRFPDDWRSHMEDVRRAARRLAHAGRVVITQKGKTVDPATFRGPVRIARGRGFGQG